MRTIGRRAGKFLSYRSSSVNSVVARHLSFGSEAVRFGDNHDNLKPPDWNNIELSQLEKNFYDIKSEISRTEVEDFREEHEISVSDSCPDPVLSFDVPVFTSFFKKTLELRGFQQPTPIQSQAWPLALTGQDFIGIAQTGSGKTLSFILPALVHSKKQEKSRYKRQPKALVIAPTRELCQQISSEAAPFCAATQLKSLSVFGGVSRLPQINALRKGIDFIVATPGRLLDLLKEGHFTLQNTSFVVLDEADRCLDMGFEPQIREIMEYVRPDRQTVMFSATWPKEIQGLASEFLHSDFEKLFVGSTKLTANKAITQEIKVARSDKAKLSFMLEAIQETTGGCLIFCASKARVDMLTDTLNENGINATAIHGDKTQAVRDKAISMLKKKQLKVLVATDVAARGLDVDNITLVINCDLPTNIESYIHRIGRTGRQSVEGQRFGNALSFFNPREDGGIVSELELVFREANQGDNFPTEILSYKSAKKSKHAFGNYHFQDTNRRYSPNKGFSKASPVASRRPRNVGYKNSF